MANSIISKSTITAENQKNKNININESLIVPTIDDEQMPDGALFLERAGGMATVTYHNGDQVYVDTVYCNANGYIKYLIDPPESWEANSKLNYISGWYSNSEHTGVKYTYNSILELQDGDDRNLYAEWSKREIALSNSVDIPAGSDTYVGFGQLLYNYLGKDGVKYLKNPVKISRTGFDDVWARAGLCVWTSEYIRGIGSEVGDYSTYYQAKAVRFGSKDIYNPSTVDYFWEHDNISVNFGWEKYNDVVTWTDIKFKTNSDMTNSISAGTTTFADLYNNLVQIIGKGNTKILAKAVSFTFNGHTVTVDAGKYVFIGNYTSGGVLNLSGSVLFGDKSLATGKSDEPYNFADNAVSISLDGGSYNTYVTYTNIEFK